MAVTDLTDALPWWARQGPGPTGGPAATPSGDGGGQARLAYLMQMFGQGGGNPADMPSPDASNVNFFSLSPADAERLRQSGGQAGGFAVPPGGPAPPQPGPMTGPAGPVSALPHPLMAAVGGPGNGPPPQSPFSQPNQGGGYPAPPSRPPFSQPNQGGGYPDGVGPPPQPAYNPLSGGSANTGLPVGAAPAPVPGPLAGGGAAPAGATSNPRFIGIDRPNAPAEGGGGMARGGGPQGTALNLAGLFGRGGVNPNAPAANAQAVSALRGPLSSAPWDYGPLQKGKVWPKDMGPFTPDQAAARGLKQRYG